MITEQKIVDFNKYCNICQHKFTKDTEEPCNECLTHPTNENSYKPINYKEVK